MHLTEQKLGPKAVPEILVVGGGKGGVGKTCFSVNTAVEIARRGWRVVLLDADLSCSNVEAVLGIKQSQQRLDDFFLKPTESSLSSIVRDTDFPNLRLIPGTSGLLDVANPRFQQKVSLIRELRRLDADLVVIDLDAGAHLNTLDFFLMAESLGIVIITPDRPSIDNAFKFLRAALFRRIERFYQSPEVALLLKRCENLNDFLESIRTASVMDAEMRQRLCQEIVALARSMQPKIVVNRVTNAYEAKIAGNILSKYARHLLYMEPSHLGHLFFDKCVPEAVNSGLPFVVGKPRQKISGCIVDMANRLGYF